MGDPSDSITVLHVDDEPDFADTVASFLEREDERFDVVTATGVDEGYDRLRGDGVDCVVTDYDLPGATGIEFLQAVREEDPDLPFILYTGKGSEEIASEAITAGVTDYLQKEAGTSQYAVLANRIRNAVEKYRTTRAVEATERKLSEIAERSEDILFMFDADWSKLLFVNSAYEDVWGGSIEELEDDPSSFLDHVHPDDRDVAEESMARLSEGESTVVEYRVIGDDGATRWVRGEGKPVLDEDGEVVRIAGFVRDVTEQREHERELESVRERMEFALDATDSYIFALDIETGRETRHGVFERVHGVDPDDVPTTESFYERCVHPDDREAVEHIERAVAGDETGDTVEFEYRTDPGHTPVRWMRTEAYVKRNDDGEPEQLVGLATDVTDRKRHEQRLERQNERLDEFASVVSHDLLSPLNVAMGRLELVREECESDHLEDVARAHDRIGALIESLLTIAREGETERPIEAVDLDGIARRAWDNVETDEGTLVVETDRGVRADRSRLQQLFENLLRNAVEHGDGPLTVTIGELDGGFFVEDDGPGLPTELGDSIFDSGVTTVRGGTGFGLSIVARIADAHGWDVRAAEGTDGGARFEVTGVEFVDR